MNEGFLRQIIVDKAVFRIPHAVVATLFESTSQVNATSYQIKVHVPLKDHSMLMTTSFEFEKLRCSLKNDSTKTAKKLNKRLARASCSITGDVVETEISSFASPNVNESVP